MQLKLKVFTLNVWGIPLGISKCKSMRMDALLIALESKNYDVICFQELWDTNDFESISSRLKSLMPFNYYFYSGLFGSGLGIISKWPILSTFFYKFPLNGFVHKIHHGDWLAGKGVALCQIDVQGKIVNVFNTHLHAQYCDRNDEYLAHRLSQAYELGQLIKFCSQSCALTILVGDCNTKPSDICLKLLLSIANLKDSFLDLEHESNYGTNESTRNSFSPPEAIKKNPDGYRLDYILFKSNSDHLARSLSYDFALPRRIPNTDVSYSDHEAIEATIGLEYHPNEVPNEQTSSNPGFEKLIQMSLKICESGIQVVGNKMKWAKVASLMIIVSILGIVWYQIDNDHHYSSFRWFVVYSPLFVSLAALGFQAILYRIESQSLIGTLNALKVLEKSFRK